MSGSREDKTEGSVVEVPVNEPTVEEMLELYAVYRDTGAAPIPKYEALLGGARRQTNRRR